MFVIDSKLLCSSISPSSLTDNVLNESVWSTEKVYVKCDNHPKHKRRIREIKISLDENPEAKGCVHCARKMGAEKKRDKLAKTSGTLADRTKELKQLGYIFEKNKDPSQIPFGGGSEYAYWRCPDCSNEWRAPIKDRLNGKCRCTECRKAAKKKKDTAYALELVSKNDLLSKEYDEKANRPFEKAGLNTKTKVTWLCSRNSSHAPWPATIKDRNHNNSGCPACAINGSSGIERAIFDHLSSFFSRKILSREKIFELEADIYIPSLKLVIEIDGSHWHRSKLSRDRDKDDTWTKNNIAVLRLRDKALPDTGAASFTGFSEVAFKNHVKCLTVILNGIYALSAAGYFRLNKVEKRKLDVIRQEGLSWVANPYNKSIRASIGNEAITKEPWLQKYLVGAVCLSSCTVRSNDIGIWRCPLCGDEYELSVANRARSFVGNCCKYQFMNSPRKLQLRKEIKNPNDGFRILNC